MTVGGKEVHDCDTAERLKLFGRRDEVIRPSFHPSVHPTLNLSAFFHR